MRNECVILLHGLARTRHSMHKMARALARAGYITLNTGYPSTRRSIEVLDDVIPSLLAENRASRFDRIHFVTHSLGGILVRRFLGNARPANLGRVVMLSPPNHGSEIVDRIGHWWLFRWLNGPAGTQLGTGPDSVPNRLGPADFPLGIITGDRCLDFYFAPLFHGPHDGKVSVASARLEGMQDFLVVPHSHPFIMRSNHVIEQTLEFLQQGRFRH